MTERARAHEQCWKGDHYEHTCQVPSQRSCCEATCDQPAGTLWGPHWCPDCDVVRLERISANLESIRDQLDRGGAS